MTSLESTKRYWDGAHAHYQQQDWIEKPSLFAEWALQYFPHHGHVLDLGGGQGQDAHFFLERGYSVTLLDFSERALKRAEERLGQDHTGKLTVTSHDISQSLPFRNDTFDAVYSHLALHYFDASTTFSVFQEIHRVLKPGGVLAALVNSTADPEYETGNKLEHGLYEINGIAKRFFTVQSLRDFVRSFKIDLLDSQGETYKDRSIGVHNLIRLLAKKA